MQHRTLAEIGHDFSCDKVTRHHFETAYDRHFGELRDQNLRILEIGIGGESYEEGGASLKMWAEYFHHSHIYGIDIYEKSFLDTPRISTFVCDQGDQASLEKLAAEIGPFDIIIDDGSHVSEKTLLSLFTLFKLLKPGGFYVVEDIQTSYWPQYGGSSLMGPFKETAMTWIKTMLDCVNACEILWPNHPALRSGFRPAEVHVYHNIAFIKKEVTQAISQVLDESLRDEWLTLDKSQHSTDERLADLLNNHPSLMASLATLLADLNSIQSRA